MQSHSQLSVPCPVCILWASCKHLFFSFRLLETYPPDEFANETSPLSSFIQISVFPILDWEDFKLYFCLLGYDAQQISYESCKENSANNLVSLVSLFLPFIRGNVSLCSSAKTKSGTNANESCVWFQEQTETRTNLRICRFLLSLCRCWSS